MGAGLQSFSKDAGRLREDKGTRAAQRACAPRLWNEFSMRVKRPPVPACQNGRTRAELESMDRSRRILPGWGLAIDRGSVVVPHVFVSPVKGHLMRELLIPACRLQVMRG